MRGAIVARTVWALALGALSGCVDDTTVIGDERSRLACSEAITLEAPPFGCTIVRVSALGPWGCSVRDGLGGWTGELSGSWVRLHREPGQSAFVRVTALASPSCGSDAGGCEMFAHLRVAGSTPCTCTLGSLESVTLDPTTPQELTLPSTDHELLIEPVGAVVEVSLCTGP